MAENRMHLEDVPSAIEDLLKITRRIEGLLTTKEKVNQQPEEDKPLTIEEAASYLHIQTSTLYSKVNKREIISYKQGGRLYFFKSDLIEYLKSGKQKTVEEIQSEAENYFNKYKSTAA